MQNQLEEPFVKQKCFHSTARTLNLQEGSSLSFVSGTPLPRTAAVVSVLVDT